MKKIFAVTLASLILSQPASAATVYGGGNAPCSTLVDNDLFDVNKGNMQWFIGFITAASAMNDGIAKKQGRRGLIDQTLDEDGWDEDTMVLYAKNQCRLHRDLRLHEVAEILLEKLAGLN